MCNGQENQRECLHEEVVVADLLSTVDIADAVDTNDRADRVSRNIDDRLGVFPVFHDGCRGHENWSVYANTRLVLAEEHQET